jgi:all-trans-retinol dehydrogenase (NAD+)
VTELANQNVLITGGASGLGRAMALKLARRGARVIVWDLHPENLARVVEELRAAGPFAQGYRCDVSNRENVYATAAQVKEEVGPVHILVNNAGIVSGKRFLECSDEQIERTMAVNTQALFWTCRAFLPEMIANDRGHLVTIASAAGLIGVAGLADYCASKWAAVGFDEAMRMELRRLASGVKTTVVCPYYINTGMFHGVRTRFPWLLPILDEDDVAERIVRAIRANRPKVAMPWLVRLLPLMRCLPSRWFDALADALGLNRAMDTFTGRRTGE